MKSKLFFYLAKDASQTRQDFFASFNTFVKNFLVNKFEFQNYEFIVVDGNKEQDAIYFDLLMYVSEQGGRYISKYGLTDFAQNRQNLLLNFVQKYKEKELRLNEQLLHFALMLDTKDLFIKVDAKGAGLSLAFQSKLKALIIDFENLAYRQRLLRGGRQKEAVARAVLQGLSEDALVFDATAGLGRESMILAHAKANVVAFERQLPMYILLKDALHRAQNSRYFPFTLPKLFPLGTIKDFPCKTLSFSSEQDLLNQSQIIQQAMLSEGITSELPEVIYYDPMFPEREGSALVKKDMFVFQQIIGHDLDGLEFLEYALKLATKRVVVKRPSFAPPLESTKIKRSYFVDGGQCRFDCYSLS